MGVLRLWQLLAPVSRNTSLEALRGKRLAVDASLWLIRFSVWRQDPESKTPDLKARTIAARQRIREELEAKKHQKLIKSAAAKLLDRVPLVTRDDASGSVASPTDAEPEGEEQDFIDDKEANEAARTRRELEEAGATQPTPSLQASQAPVAKEPGGFLREGDDEDEDAEDLEPRMEPIRLPGQPPSPGPEVEAGDEEQQDEEGEEEAEEDVWVDLGGSDEELDVDAVRALPPEEAARVLRALEERARAERAQRVAELTRRRLAAQEFSQLQLDALLAAQRHSRRLRCIQDTLRRAADETAPARIVLASSPAESRPPARLALFSRKRGRAEEEKAEEADESSWGGARSPFPLRLSAHLTAAPPRPPPVPALSSPPPSPPAATARSSKLLEAERSDEEEEDEELQRAKLLSLLEVEEAELRRARELSLIDAVPLIDLTTSPPHSPVLAPASADDADDVEWEPVVAWEAPPEYQHQQQQQQQQEARQAEVVWEMELRGQQRSRPEPAGLEAELPLEPLRPTSPPKPKANSQQPSPQASAQEEAARLGEALARASAAASAGANPETGEPFSGGLGGVSLRDEFARDVREQLRLFGIPWVQAPGEAEAQCVELERAGLVDGIISDDSDCLVFGARVVYKNIFERERYVERYDAQVIERELGLDRNRLLELALLLGSDYTEGVRGIGPVHALEVLQAFPGSPLEGLREFARWLRGEAPDPEHLPEDLRALRCPGRVTLPPGFPSETVLRAYLEPNVDSSREPFEWARPRLDDLRAYARLKFGWRDDKIDGLLLPMFRRFDQGPAQGTLDGFVAPRAQPLRSLRLQSAIDRLRGVEPAPARPKTPVNKRQKAAAKQQTEGTPSAKDSELAAAAATATKKKRKQAATSKGDAEDEKKPKRGKKKKSKDHPHGPTQPQPSLHPSLQSSAPCVPSSAV